MHTENRKRLGGAVAFITLMGIVSLFSDMTHEGARSVLGEYLNLAGATGATIGFVSGVGELCGYSLRLLSGIFADRTKNTGRWSSRATPCRCSPFRRWRSFPKTAGSSPAGL